MASREADGKVVAYCAGGMLRACGLAVLGGGEEIGAAQGWEAGRGYNRAWK